MLLAKWMIRSPQLLMLDEAIQGVDVGTRQQIYGVSRDTATSGASVITPAQTLSNWRICARGF